MAASCSTTYLRARWRGQIVLATKLPRKRSIVTPTANLDFVGRWREPRSALTLPGWGSPTSARPRNVELRFTMRAVIIACASWAVASAGTPLNCAAKKVVIVDAPSGSRTSETEEHLSFSIDEAGRKISFADGVPLSIRRFDAQWISATYGDVSYEFDRRSDRLSYAGASAKDGTTTIVIGSGRCTSAENP
jgi:hypothetical protein